MKNSPVYRPIAALGRDLPMVISTHSCRQVADGFIIRQPLAELGQRRRTPRLDVQHVHPLVDALLTPQRRSQRHQPMIIRSFQGGTIAGSARSAQVAHDGRHGRTRPAVQPLHRRRTRLLGERLQRHLLTQDEKSQKL